MLAEISAGYTSLKAAVSIVQGLNATHTQIQINEVKIELQRLMLDAQSALMGAQTTEATASKRISDLEQQVVRFKTWEGEKERYELKRYYPGSFAFALKPEMANGEPPHRLCANCYQNGEKAILQAKNEYGTILGHRCPLCKNEIWMSAEAMPDA